ncbi:hypothetical protein FDP41_005907 [Naegleria fowleri]|uniref:SHSP domain-containing protein n=1 Tax=Naegleria fowleri TaxID=5763 RepID=A0A6A5BM55_NAEFO|nr:uncharacterized protein FDP41_005907 [Naegleria fowleri]KAF0975154.1 hypothetical protein FDP41_005907 [Naegleria fowleri]CAG4711429.1 unnamed protein product [Naegleria fowleri]
MVRHNKNTQLAKPQRSGFGLLDTFFDDPWFRAFDRFDDRLEQVWKPTTDISETDKELKVICNLPGITKENVKIDVDEENRLLTVSGHMDKEKKEENETYHCVERSHGDFSRTVYLPPNTDMNNIKANLEHGVLRVIVPKNVQEKKTRSISVE